MFFTADQDGEGRRRDGAIHGDRHELCRVQCEGGKGGIEGGGSQLLLRQPAHQLHGSGGYCRRVGCDQGGGGGWIRRLGQGRCAVIRRCALHSQRTGGDAAG